MIALVVNVLFTVAFFHVIRSAQAKRRNVMVVAVVNYVVASPICFFLSYAQGNLNLSGETLFWGAVQGICFIGTYYLLCTSHVRQRTGDFNSDSPSIRRDPCSGIRVRLG
jgi:hypothetical protein